MMIGGMPETVVSWQEQRSLEAISQIHHALLATYRDDFVKYPGRISQDRLDDLTWVNKGGLSEQVVGQLLKALEPSYKEAHLYYWLREQKGSSAEIDYLLQHEGRIIPIEVKAGSTGSLKSLHYFMHVKGLKQAVRINADHPSAVVVDTKIHTGEAVKYLLLSLPFYLIGQLHRLLDTSISEQNNTP
ncbi:MAG: DUF4143 domain-containing protein [Legionellaceae bacterium]|nr:DUF4143 domain-containing protein [Legionellaceae bacterium]